MELTIRPLMPELAGDYFDFFENRAFTDDSPYRCYCQMYQLSKEQQKVEFEHFKGTDYGLLSRAIAEKQINSGELCGYLAYINGMSIGWCNANDRANFPSEPYCDVIFHSPIPNIEMAVVCFEIAPDYRGRGVAAALLHRVIHDAKAKGYAAVDGFPAIRTERYEWDCAGPVRLYEKLGFIKVAEQEGCVIMRKEL